MHHAEIARAFEATLFLSMIAALGLGAHRALATAPALEAPVVRTRSAPALLLHPLVQFLLVCAVVYVNQVLFGAFIPFQVFRLTVSRSKATRRKSRSP